MTTESRPFLEVDRLRVAFPVVRGILTRRTLAEVVAVDDVSFTLAKGRTLGIVGESGCGKSTLLRAILQLQQVAAGEVRLNGVSLSGLSAGELQSYRKRIQVVFQDPFVSLNPRMTIFDIVREPLDLGRVLPASAPTRQRVLEVLSLVGIAPSAVQRYPHQFSGGQKQRIAIARAIAPRPDLILFDEPTSALDVSVRAQVMNLLSELRTTFELTYVLVSHDLDAVSYLCDEVIVMYLGRVVEAAVSSDIYASPLHPYTQLLLSSVKIDFDEAGSEETDLDPPSAFDVPPGCPFHPRCALHQRLGRPDACLNRRPALEDAGGGRRVACHFVSESAQSPYFPAAERAAGPGAG